MQTLSAHEPLRPRGCKNQAIDNEVLERRAVKEMGAQDLADLPIKP